MPIKDHLLSESIECTLNFSYETKNEKLKFLRTLMTMWPSIIRLNLIMDMKIIMDLVSKVEHSKEKDIES